MHKRIGDMKRFLTKAGLTLVSFDSSKGGRITATAKAGTDETRIFSLSGGGSDDVRGDLNEFSRMKRFARECPPPPLNTAIIDALKPHRDEFKHVAAVAPPTEEQAMHAKTVEQYLPPGYIRKEGKLIYVGNLKMETNLPEAPAPEPQAPEPQASETPKVTASMLDQQRDRMAKARAILAAKRDELRAAGKPIQNVRKDKGVPRKLIPVTHMPRKPIAADKTSEYSERAKKARAAQLSMGDNYRFMEWLKGQPDEALVSFEVVQKAATEALGLAYPVTINAISTAMDFHNRQFVVSPRRTYKTQNVVLAQALMRLEKELGLTPTPGLAEIAKER